MEDIEELRKKVNLVDEERKAYINDTSKAKQKNKEKILELQKENKDLKE